jgi:hypothetical protein
MPIQEKIAEGVRGYVLERQPNFDPSQDPLLLLSCKIMVAQDSYEEVHSSRIVI